jgi:hypothetical protein
LVEFDDKLPRNGTQGGDEPRNYADTCGLEQVLGLCREKGNSIVVGFDGGAEKLLHSGVDELLKRRFKWDFAKGGSGVKNTKNWIEGRMFLGIIEGLADS